MSVDRLELIRKERRDNRQNIPKDDRIERALYEIADELFELRVAVQSVRSNPFNK